MAATTTRIIRLLTLSFFIYAVLAVPSQKRVANPRFSRHVNESTDSSSATACAAPIVAPKQNVWDSLTNDETASITQWLFDQQDLNLTKASEAGDWDNTVFVAPTLFGSFVFLEAKLM